MKVRSIPENFQSIADLTHSLPQMRIPVCGIYHSLSAHGASPFLEPGLPLPI